MNKEIITKYWAYNDIESHGYKISFKDTKDSVIVNISDKYGVQARFKIKSYKYNLDTFDIKGYSIYDITNCIRDITNELEYTETLEDCVKGVLYYFNTRY